MLVSDMIEILPSLGKYIYDIGRILPVKWSCIRNVNNHSLDGRQNRYSYVTVSTVAAFGGDYMGLKPPWS
jgi:hypothetical protein